eukprot:8561694-Lingulodinium_polyedra.AAC.1
MREAVQNGSTCEGILSWRPWAASIADFQTEITRSTAPMPDDPGLSSVPPPATGGAPTASAAESSSGE